MDDRHEHAATIMISQIPSGQWYQSIENSTLADAQRSPNQTKRRIYVKNTIRID